MTNQLLQLLNLLTLAVSRCAKYVYLYFLKCAHILSPYILYFICYIFFILFYISYFIVSFISYFSLYFFHLRSHLVSFVDSHQAFHFAGEHIFQKYFEYFKYLNYFVFSIFSIFSISSLPFFWEANISKVFWVSKVFLNT